MERAYEKQLIREDARSKRPLKEEGGSKSDKEGQPRKKATFEAHYALIEKMEKVEASLKKRSKL